MAMTEQERALAITLALTGAKRYLRAALELAGEGVTPQRREILLRLAARTEWMRRSFRIALNPAELELVAVGGPMDGREVHLELAPDRLMESHEEKVLLPRSAAVHALPCHVQLGDSLGEGYAYRLDLKTCRLHFMGLQEAVEVPNARN